MRIYSLLAVLFLTGCSMIPSFWDDNEAHGVAKIRHSVDALDCSGNYLLQARQIQSDVRFLELYSSSKGSNDLLEMVKPMKETIDGLVEKEENKVSKESSMKIAIRVGQIMILEKAPIEIGRTGGKQNF